MKKLGKRSLSRQQLETSITHLLKQYTPIHSSSKHLTPCSKKVLQEEYLITKKLLSRHKIPFDALRSSTPSPVKALENSVQTPQIKSRKSLRTVLSHQSLQSINKIRSPMPITGSRVHTLERRSRTPMMVSYNKLIRSCSEVEQDRKFLFENEEKRVKKISKVIKVITKDPDVKEE
jgi:hypothetical protein